MTEKTSLVLEERCRHLDTPCHGEIYYVLFVEGKETIVFPSVSDSNIEYGHALYDGLKKYMVYTSPDEKIDFSIKRDKSPEALKLKERGRGVGYFESTRISDLFDNYNMIRGWNGIKSKQSGREYFNKRKFWNKEKEQFDDF